MTWILQKIDSKIPDIENKMCLYTKSFLNIETGEVKQFVSEFVEKKGSDAIIEMLNKQS